MFVNNYPFVSIPPNAVPVPLGSHNTPRSCRPKSGRLSAGFTLVELIVVIAIVAILGTILIPTFTELRRKSLTTQCVSNLRQIGVALGLYLSDNQGYFPPNRHNLNHHTESTPDGVWEQDMLKVYLDGARFDTAGAGESVTYQEAGVFHCPMDENRRYRNAALSYGSHYALGAGNGTEGDKHFSEVRHPSRTGYMIDMIRNTAARTGTAYFRHNDYPFGNNTNSGSQWAVDFRHGGNANVLFVDGHVETLSLKQLKGTNPDNIRTENTN